MQRLLILLLVKSMRGANLMLLAQPNKMEVLCTLFSPRYWQIVQEIIARIGMLWWNASCTTVAGSVVHKAVIKYNLGKVSCIFDELHLHY